ncbi:hypothetical protein [Zavarzinia sp.]|uniref:hypothetical protein n=1 Tax=Zavarzinia sp. TaxID=2027920 RepID=UPI003BB53555|nr:hypothetical protein [Zavarzinia sp.]
MTDISPRPIFRRGEFERQAILAIGSLLTAGILWMAATISDNTTAVAGLRIQIEALRDQVAELKSLGKAALPADDARREIGRVDALVVDLEARLRRVEGRR